MNEIYFSISIILINLIWVISPWPWFLIVIKNSLIYWKKWWFLTWLGIAFWDLTHMIYCFLWIWVLISKSIIIFTILKILWSLYLIYIWLKSLLNNLRSDLSINTNDLKSNNYKNCFKNWFLITIINPKATLMFLWIFSTILTPKINIFQSLTIILFMFLNPIIWFSLVSIFVNNKSIKNEFIKYELIINKIFWILLIFFWIIVLIK